jgi:hypothetical protein
VGEYPYQAVGQLPRSPACQVDLALPGDLVAPMQVGQLQTSGTP